MNVRVREIISINTRLKNVYVLVLFICMFVSGPKQYISYAYGMIIVLKILLYTNQPSNEYGCLHSFCNVHLFVKI